MSSYSNLQLGQTITIGKYYKYANDLNTKELIDWIVLDIDTNAKKALVVSKYALECGPYHDMPEDITWEDSDIVYAVSICHKISHQDCHDLSSKIA